MMMVVMAAAAVVAVLMMMLVLVLIIVVIVMVVAAAAMLLVVMILIVIMVVLMLELCVFSWYNVMHLAELTPSFQPACAAVPLAVAYFAPAVGYTLAMLAYMKKYLVKGEGKK